MIRVAIIEDDPLVRSSLKREISEAVGIETIGEASSLKEGAVLVDQGGFDVLICDLGLPDGDGCTLVDACARRHPDADVLVLTVFADHQKVLAAIRAGARGYLLKDQIATDCIAAIKEVRDGGSPISPIIARLLLAQFRPQAAAQMPQDQALVPSKSTTPPSHSVSELLSAREVETLHLLARGFTYVECAELLKISTHTVGSHVKHIYRKLEVSSRAEAVFEASSLGLIDPH